MKQILIFAWQHNAGLHVAPEAMLGMQTYNTWIVVSKSILLYDMLVEDMP